MNIMINGACGHMGMTVQKLLATRWPDTTVIPVDSNADCPDIYPTPSAFAGKADCVLDFSHHSATKALTEYAVRTGTPLVIATTGQTEEERAMIRAAAEKIPLFFASNLSLGIAVLMRLAIQAAQAFPDADIEIVEVHHNRKLDVPSGTALSIAEKLKTVREDAHFNIGRHENGRRTKNEIGIHSLRMGDTVGIHEIILSTGAQTLTLKHEAHDRSLLAEGGISAAMFLLGKPAGLYDMDDLLEG